MVNLTSVLQVDTIVINDDAEIEVKPQSATNFDSDNNKSSELVDDRKFFPQDLISTQRYVREGPESSLVFSMIRVGLPDATLDAIQDMERCERSQRNCGTISSDDFCYFFYCEIFHAARICSKTKCGYCSMEGTSSISHASLDIVLQLSPSHARRF